MRGRCEEGGAAAFFDIDGTLVRGHMILDFPDYLFEAGLFDAAQHERVRKMREEHSAGRLPYRRVAEALPGVYALGVRGRGVDAVRVKAEEFVQGRMGRVFSFSAPLVSLMAGRGWPGIALSGSPLETVLPMARALGMEAAFGTELEAVNGVYTGRVLRNMILGEGKRPVYEQIIELEGLDEGICFGFGDTEEDLSFLERVGHPVALNPGPGLRAGALERGWPIFMDGDDVVNGVRVLVEGVEVGRRG
ncbi:MAG: HAD family hydrolase [Thermoplasmatota archaeon]